jgi:single-strand DNA-binding protein
MVNEAIIIGNLGQDPELRHTGSGTAVCSLSVATNRKWKNKDGELQDDTQWHKVVVWDKQAESCAEYLSKGRQVYVRGRLQTRDWEDKEGVKRYTTEIVAQEVKFLGGKDGGGSGGGRSDAPPPPGDDDLPF